MVAGIVAGFWQCTDDVCYCLFALAWVTDFHVNVSLYKGIT